MDSIIQYFNGEKLQCIVGVVISLICIALSAYFLVTQNPFLKGIAYSFLPISLFLLIICVSVILRTPGDIERVTNFHQEEPTKIQSEELPRMEKVMKSFGIIKNVELGLFLIGVVLIVMFWQNPLIRGIAAGLIIQGVVMYLFDHVAESRGEIYVSYLKSL